MKFGIQPWRLCRAYVCGMDSTNLVEMNNTYILSVGAIALYVVNVLESPPAVEVVRGVC